jgi:hypothetical protein
LLIALEAIALLDTQSNVKLALFVISFTDNDDAAALRNSFFSGASHTEELC